jgi:hypothetical protein
MKKSLKKPSKELGAAEVVAEVVSAPEFGQGFYAYAEFGGKFFVCNPDGEVIYVKATEEEAKDIVIKLSR